MPNQAVWRCVGLVCENAVAGKAEIGIVMVCYVCSTSKLDRKRSARDECVVRLQVCVHSSLFDAVQLHKIRSRRERDEYRITRQFAVGAP